MSASARTPRITFIRDSLAWAYLASLHRSDFVRASQLLATFQRTWNETGGYIGPLAHVRAQLASPLRVDGMWELRTATAVAVSLSAEVSDGDRELLQATAGPGGTGAAGAADFFNVILFDLAPLGSEPVWLAYDWAQEVAPWDVTAHMRQRVSDFVEGFDSGDEFLPPEAQRAGVPVGTPTVYTGPAFDITATPLRAARPSYWPWAIAGAGVLTLAGILAWRKWGKK